MRRGVIYMALAMLGFTLMVACVKTVRVEMSTLDVMLWRSLLTAPMVLVLTGGRDLKIHRKGLFALRVCLGFGAMFCAFTATRGLAVADFSLIWRLQPGIIALAAPFFLGAGERPGKRVIGVLIAGLVGCSVLLGPRLEMGPEALVWGLWAVGGAALSSLAHVCLRALGATERSTTLVFWLQVSVVGLCVLISGATTGDPLPLPPAHLWWILIASAVAATVGQVLMTMAYKIETATVVSTTGYLSLVWGVGVDFLLFDQPPTSTMLLGGAIIVGASVLLLKPATPRPEPAAEGA